MKIDIHEQSGRCRWCRCTYLEPCASGCSWANPQQTLCSACVPLDRALLTVEGRRELAEFLQRARVHRAGEVERPKRLQQPAAVASASALPRA